MTNEQLQKRKIELENALRDVNIALNHEEYANPFKFERNDTIKPSSLKHTKLKEIMSKCIQNGSGFDPNLICQHVEQEALEQFNNIVKTTIKGLSIPTLMEIRHETELIMLKDRESHYKNEIGKIEKMILESVTGVQASDLQEEKKVVKIDKRRKANKE